MLFSRFCVPRVFFQGTIVLDSFGCFFFFFEDVCCRHYLAHMTKPQSCHADQGPRWITSDVTCADVLDTSTLRITSCRFSCNWSGSKVGLWYQCSNELPFSWMVRSWIDHAWGYESHEFLCLLFVFGRKVGLLSLDAGSLGLIYSPFLKQIQLQELPWNPICHSTKLIFKKDGQNRQWYWYREYIFSSRPNTTSADRSWSMREGETCLLSNVAGTNVQKCGYNFWTT